MILTKKIEQALSERITGGYYSDGEKLPSLRELSDEFNASYVIVSRAVQALKAEGLVATCPGRGTFAVRSRSPLHYFQSRRICFVFADPQSNPREEYQLELYSIMQKLIRERGFIDVALQCSDARIDEPETLAGAIIVHRSELLPLLRAHGVPVVGCSGAGELPYSSVVPDFYRGSYDMTRYLAGLNHRKIIFVMPSESDNAGSFGMRLQGNRDAMADCGLPALPPVQWHSMTHRSEIRALLESPERPDALFVANDVMAIEIMQLAEMLRLSVPDDISIAGLENMHRSTLSTPQLTTAGYDKRLLAEECVKLLFEHIDNRNVGVTARKVPMELIVRGSTAEKRQ